MPIVKEELSVRNLNLVVVFHRGLLYLSARNLAPVGVKIKDWFNKEFGIRYMVVLRYQAFACLILRYPRLMVCGLTFNQIVKHKDHIMTYLKDDTELAAQLAVAVNLAAQNKLIDILPSASLPVPKGKFCVDADYVYEDDPASDDIPSGVDLNWEASLEAARRNGQLLDAIYGAEKTEQDDLETLLGELEVTNK